MATFPKYHAQLALEAEEALARREAVLDGMRQQLENLKGSVEELQMSFAEPDCPHTEHEKRQMLKNRMKEVREGTKTLKAEIKLLEDKMKRAPQFERDNYRRHAEEWFEKAKKVLDTSKKNKLYLGNRQYVTAHAKDNPNKKKRYLDAGVWSWGVNLGWIEGGITAKVSFRIKFNPGDQFEGFPEGSLDAIWCNPYMSAEEWLALCRQYPDSLLYQGEENRLTWFAMEVEAALDAGYHFESGYSKSGADKLTLVCG